MEATRSASRPRDKQGQGTQGTEPVTAVGHGAQDVCDQDRAQVSFWGPQTEWTGSWKGLCELAPGTGTPGEEWRG